MKKKKKKKVRSTFHSIVSVFAFSLHVILLLVYALLIDAVTRVCIEGIGHLIDGFLL